MSSEKWRPSCLGLNVLKKEFAVASSCVATHETEKNTSHIIRDNVKDTGAEIDIFQDNYTNALITDVLFLCGSRPSASKVFTLSYKHVRTFSTVPPPQCWEMI